MVLLLVTVRIENAKRDKRYGQPSHGDNAVAADEALASDLTDGNNHNFRYMY